jgi:16S rRNA A1518/A1519 N6-dimethyltransferase RsmA/KsgA/DIM1 with predicted DNA glycosylase/AP lyase activity
MPSYFLPSPKVGKLFFQVTKRSVHRYFFKVKRITLAEFKQLNQSIRCCLLQAKKGLLRCNLSEAGDEKNK